MRLMMPFRAERFRTVAATLKTWPYFRRPVDDDASNEAIWDAYDRVLQRREALSGRLS